MKITQNMINMIIKYIIIWIINKIKFLSKSNFVSDAFHIVENWRMINYLYKIVKKNSKHKIDNLEIESSWFKDAKSSEIIENH